MASLTPGVSRRLLMLLLCWFAWAPSSASSHVSTYPLPAEVRSPHFRVTINGQPADVLHAVSGYYLVNFVTSGPSIISVKADDPHYWDRGVEVQPMRFGIRPVRRGATITFPIQGPQKLTIARPGDHFADAEMLYLFANPVAPAPPSAASPAVRYYGPGIHRENIDAHSGETIYLDGGAVIFGSLNLWQVHDVHVFGHGTIIYDGPQDPHADQGWMHKPNWHCIVMDQARNIEIDGITCITRSRSWQIQMRDSRQIGLYNVKVIGGNPNDANQDGIDWLGGGDTRIADSFFRASDDVFAMYGNWDGYEPALLRQPGHDVTNITIERTIATTSISNILRSGWPEKTFNSAHVHLADLDVLHAGFGGCKVPFAFFEMWADPAGRGSHRDYTFRDIRLEHWYSLFSLRQPLPELRDISFDGVWAMDGAGMLPCVLDGDIAGVSARGATLQGVQGETATVAHGAEALHIEAAPLNAKFTYSAGVLRPGQPIHFAAAEAAGPGIRFVWLFGDGTESEGREVDHRFADAEGTLLDGSGRFRVLLHVTGAGAEQAWQSQRIVLAPQPRASGTPAPRFVALAATRQPAGMVNEPLPTGARSEERSFKVPADGGYTFTLLTSTQATIAIDDQPPHATPKTRLQFCGSVGNAVQPVELSAVLLRGPHRLRIVRNDSFENAVAPTGEASPGAIVFWEGPSLDRQLLGSPGSPR